MCDDPTVFDAERVSGEAAVAAQAVHLGGMQEGHLQNAARLLGQGQSGPHDALGARGIDIKAIGSRFHSPRDPAEAADTSCPKEIGNLRSAN